MGEVELAKALRIMYNKGLKIKEQTTMIHLFGIKYAGIIKSNKYNPRIILEYAKMLESYQAEINKGIRLAKYTMQKAIKIDEIKDSSNTYFKLNSLNLHKELYKG